MADDPIRDLTDQLEIGDLITRYATAVDRRDWDLYRSVFTTDAEIDPARVQRFQHTKILRHFQRRIMAEHDTARANPQVLRPGRNLSDHDFRCGPR